jgi:putative transposase
MMQVVRNLTDIDDGFLRGKRYLILDRDTKYSDAFRSFHVRDGIKIIRLPPRSPNLKDWVSYCTSFATLRIG